MKRQHQEEQIIKVHLYRYAHDSEACKTPYTTKQLGWIH